MRVLNASIKLVNIFWEMISFCNAASSADHKQAHLPVKEYPIAVPILEALGGVYGVVCKSADLQSSDGLSVSYCSFLISAILET